MSIIGKLNRLIFGASGNPAEQAPMQSTPHPEQAQSSKAGENDPRFSENDMLAVQQRAETVQRAFNESLSIANQSKNRAAREYKLQIAREWLIELKKLANKFPFLHLQNLQAVEASITAVEAETRLLPYGEVVDISSKDVPDKARPESLALQGKGIESPERGGQDRQRLSEREEQVILMCIQSCFRDVNESIEIARKSKNLETKLSRLRVARDCLKEAQRQASQFSLEIEGFDKAEAEINRIDEAIKTGTPTEIAGMQQIDVNVEFSSPARNLLKEATALKREKKYIEACDKLREAYSADGAENLMIEDRLRLPMYLQLAGKNDDGWDELNRLSARYVDQFSQPRIAYQMTIFLRKENNESASNPVRVIVRGDSKPLEATPDANGKTINEMQYAPSSVGKTIGELQSEPMSAWGKWGNVDIITGLEFSATMQLRTPLRVLLRHGEIHTDRNTKPPEIVHEGWEGSWLPKLKTFREIGLDMNEPPPGAHASSIGPIVARDYLPFLIAIREIVELNESIENRIDKLREMLSVCDWQEFLGKHGGTEKIVQYFFPRYIQSMPKLPPSAMNEFVRLGYFNTPSSIEAATDEELLSIKGIGPAKLKAIRKHFADIAKHRDVDRVENVIR